MFGTVSGESKEEIWDTMQQTSASFGLFLREKLVRLFPYDDNAVNFGTMTCNFIHYCKPIKKN
jgi:hypothetical protein